MVKYLISYTETNVYSIVVEASDEEAAETKASSIWDKEPDLFDRVETSDSFFQVEGEV